MPSQKNRLILIVGYEVDRALSVIEALEPANLTLIYGAPNKSTTEKQKDANKRFSELVETALFDYPNIEKYEISCDDPDAAAKDLIEIFDKYDEENIIVMPMNNKLSTIGLIKALRNNNGVQACYAPALVYNEIDYSSIGSFCYVHKYK